MSAEMQISCPTRTKLGSDMLEQLGSILEASGHSVQEQRYAVPERGGELASGLTIGLVGGVLSNAVYEALKYVVRRLRDSNRSDYDPNIQIRIQIEVTISDFEEGRERH